MDEKLPAIPKTAFVLHLQSGAEAAYPMPPERKPRVERWFGGAVHFPALEKPGIYQVTLSEEAWTCRSSYGNAARAKILPPKFITCTDRRSGLRSSKFSRSQVANLCLPNHTLEDRERSRDCFLYHFRIPRKR